MKTIEINSDGKQVYLFIKHIESIESDGNDVVVTTSSGADYIFPATTPEKILAMILQRV